MWFYPVIGLVVILAIVGGTLAGGVFTIVLIPLAAIALISAIVYGVWGRAMEGASGNPADAASKADRPLPHRQQRPSSRVRTSPERLVDARRQQQ